MAAHNNSKKGNKACGLAPKFGRSFYALSKTATDCPTTRASNILSKHNPEEKKAAALPDKNMAEISKVADRIQDSSTNLGEVQSTEVSPYELSNLRSVRTS